MRIAWLFIVCFCLFGCGRTGPTEIRVANRSERDLHDVVVHGVNFGDIRSGTMTGYIRIEPAPQAPTVIARSGTNHGTHIDTERRRGPGAGHFTYALTLDAAGHLIFEVEQDK